MNSAANQNDLLRRPTDRPTDRPSTPVPGGNKCILEGVQGLKSLGVRDLHHKMAFLACNVLSGTMRIGDEAADNNEEATPATIKVNKQLISRKKLILKKKNFALFFKSGTNVTC